VREYETVFILHPKVDDAGIDREIEAVKKTIGDGKGELIGVHKWGRRKMAYPIRKAADGFYVIVRFKSGSETLPELDRKFRINESVLRSLTVISPGGEWPPDLKSRERRPPRGDGRSRDRRSGGRDFRRGAPGPMDDLGDDDDDNLDDAAMDD
jgi:small subunit ribosomal protein S6